MLQDATHLRRVFISSATGKLAGYRMAAVEVCNRLGLRPVHMEEFAADPAPPIEACLRMVEESDVFVLIVAHRYGSRPPGERLGFTELEYLHAKQLGLPVHAFLVDPEFPWPSTDMDHGVDRQALDAFSSLLRRDHVVKQFGKLVKFREDMLLTLQDYRLPLPAATGGGKPTGRPRDLIPPPPALHAVPAYVSAQPFVGRESELAQLDDWAAHSTDPMMVVEAVGGLGKSALVWHWLERRAPEMMPGLQGRLWWSFYEGAPSTDRFLQETAAYLTGQSREECSKKRKEDLLSIVVNELRARPYVLVLDGLERLLVAYNRFDPTKLRDEQVDSTARAVVDPYTREVLRALVSVRPSRIVVSSRLTPSMLEGPTGHPIGGVRLHRLTGLSDAETLNLVRRLGLKGDELRIRQFFGGLGNHPLLIGAACGLVRDYRRAPGDLGAWLADPAAGGAMHLQDSDLSQRRTRVLAAALAGLDPAHRQVLGWISVFAYPISYLILEGINPLLPPRPQLRDADEDDDDLESRLVSDQYNRALEEWRRSPEVAAASVRLDRALDDLEERGLLMWDRTANTYDLHPVVRGFAFDQLEAAERLQANARVRDHFTALPPDDVAKARSIEDLQQSITIYRALIGCGNPAEARGVFSRIASPLLFGLSAFPTVIELLEPLLEDENTDLNTLNTAASALAYVGRLDDAGRIFENLLKGDATYDTGVIMVNLIEVYHLAKQPLAEWQALKLLDHHLKSPERTGETGVRAISLNHWAHYWWSVGEPRKARQFHQAAVRMGDPGIAPAQLDELAILRARFAIETRSATERMLRETTAKLTVRRPQLLMGELWVEYWLQAGRYDAALAAAHAAVHDSHALGIESMMLQGEIARILARSGQLDQARALVDELVVRLDSVHPSRRPYEALAEVLIALGDKRATDYTLAAYGQAWADGPPNSLHRDLVKARRLLARLGVKEPRLPVRHPSVLVIVRPDSLAAEIAAFEAEQLPRKQGRLAAWWHRLGARDH